MLGMGEYFSKEITSPLLQLYWRNLKHLNDMDLQAAVDSCIAECEYFPRIPEIKKRLPEKPMLVNKGSLTWCDNTQKLLNEYGGL